MESGCATVLEESSFKAHFPGATNVIFNGVWFLIGGSFLSMSYKKNWVSSLKLDSWKTFSFPFGMASWQERVLILASVVDLFREWTTTLCRSMSGPCSITIPFFKPLLLLLLLSLLWSLSESISWWILTLLLLMAEILHHLGCMKPYK